MDYTHFGLGAGLPLQTLPLIVVFLLWVLFWKGVALWTAAKHGDKAWFVALLIVNTLGILEMCYFFLVAKKKFSDLPIFKRD